MESNNKTTLPKKGGGEVLRRLFEENQKRSRNQPLIKIWIYKQCLTMWGSLVLAHDACGSDGQRPDGPPPGRERFKELTDEQKTCLEGILGEPGQGERPTREAMEAALTKCGIKKAE